MFDSQLTVSDFDDLSRCNDDDEKNRRINPYLI